MIDLLTTIEYGGCSAKLSAKELDALLVNFPVLKNENILIDNTLHDDAGVYKISDSLAIIFTTDFFPPICSDPYMFGKIAAANSLSDIYAMGGEPFLALNINMYPSTLPLDGLSEILRGGNDKAIEAGTAILGGHTIEDAVPKYGLAVIGKVDPHHIIVNSGLKAGQKLILTKRIGTGAIQAAQRVGLASNNDIEQMLTSMSTLNANAMRILLKYNPTGGTDITGFGLAGHCYRMALASHVSLEIESSSIPYFECARNIYDQGCIPGATFRNKEFVGNNIHFNILLTYEEKALIFDPQTSGGLLFGVNHENADAALVDLKCQGIDAWIIGSVIPLKDKYIYVK